MSTETQWRTMDDTVASPEKVERVRLGRALAEMTPDDLEAELVMFGLWMPEQTEKSGNPAISLAAAFKVLVRVRELGAKWYLSDLSDDASIDNFRVYQLGGGVPAEERMMAQCRITAMGASSAVAKAIVRTVVMAYRMRQWARDQKRKREAEADGNVAS